MRTRDASGSEPDRRQGIMKTRPEEGAAVAWHPAVGPETGDPTDLPATSPVVALAVDEGAEDILVEVDG